jgi:hypothetical protein
MMHTVQSLLKLAQTPAGVQQIRKTVARLEGWRSAPSRHSDFKLVWLRGGEHCYALPDYTGSRDAIAEVEGRLEAVERWNGEEHQGSCEAYMDWLQYILREASGRKGNDDFEFLTATALHRSMAVVLLLQKETDDE